MTALVNDTRQKQIIRGEVWFGSFEMTSLTSAGTYLALGVLTDTNEVQFNLEHLCTVDLDVVLYEGVAFAAGPPGLQTNVNMRLSSSNTTSVEVTTDRSLTSFTSIPLTYTSPAPKDGYVQQDILPFKEGSGIILKANTQYAIAFKRSGVEISSVQLAWFFREI